MSSVCDYYPSKCNREKVFFNWIVIKTALSLKDDQQIQFQ